jgi:hypothetical protein
MSGEQEAIAEPSDAALFESAVSDQEPAHQEPEPQSQPRDDHGRFAAKAQAEADAAAAAAGQEPAPQQEPEKDHRIPIRELLDERDRRQAAEREREALKQRIAAYERQQRQAAEAPQAPNPLVDPEGYDLFLREQVDSGTKSARQAAREDFVNLTFDLAIDQHGEEAVSAAMAALETARDPHAANEIGKAKNPAKALMEWHRGFKARAEVGNDLDGYLKRKQDEWAKDPEVRKRILEEAAAEARTPGNRSTVINMPSLNRTTGGGGSRPGGTPVSDGDFFNDAVAGLNRR